MTSQIHNFPQLRVWKHHNLISKFLKLVPCSAKGCPKVFDTVHQALRHIRDMHGQMEITRFRITNRPHWFIKCKECQYGFTAQKAYDTVCIHFCTENLLCVT